MIIIWDWVPCMELYVYDHPVVHKTQSQIFLTMTILELFSKFPFNECMIQVIFKSSDCQNFGVRFSG